MANILSITNAVTAQLNNQSAVSLGVASLQVAQIGSGSCANSELAVPTTGVALLGPGMTYSITGATNASPIVVTATGNTFLTGDVINIGGVTGNTAANNQWIVTVISAGSTFSLNGSTGNGAYVTGGAASKTGVFWGKNLDSTNTINILVNSGGTVICEIQPGEAWMFRFGYGVTSPVAQSLAGTPLLNYVIFAP
jgi:hypothetical protein